MNAISYSIFGHNTIFKDSSYRFGWYLRLFSLNLKMNDLIYPDWWVNVCIDENTYNSPYKEYFDYHADSGRIKIQFMPTSDLCKMMLWRLAPVFGDYDRIICRDIDSLPTYRERQAVEYWIKTGRIAHAITDHQSHNINLMGGMIGFNCKGFIEAIGVKDFDELMQLGEGIDFTTKGADQTFLNRIILPKIQHSITEHYVNGNKQSFRGECYNYIQDEPIQKIAPELKESNHLIEYIGQSGVITEPVLLFLSKYLPSNRHEYYNAIEDKFKEVHFWRYDV